MSRSICINDFVKEIAMRRQTISCVVEVKEAPPAVIKEEAIAEVPVGVPEPLPPEILELMATAMLDPTLGKTATPLGNEIRKQVLLRTLQAAEENGWRLTRIQQNN